MKPWMAAAAAFALLTGITAANAQNAPAAGSDKSDKTMQQSSSASGQQGTTMRHASKTHRPRHRVVTTRSMHIKPRATTGSSSRTGTNGGVQNDPSIHQSKQRDSRGTPKGTGPDQNK